MSRWHNIDGFADLPLGAFQAEQVGLTTRIKLHGGGGGNTETTSTGTTTTSNLPEYAQPYFEELMGRTQAASITPYQQYGGDRVAQFEPAQKTAQQNILGMQTPSDLGAARTGMQDVAAGAKSASYAPGTFVPGYAASPITQGYQAGTMAAPEFTSAQAQKYMSPYQQQVIDVEKREATRQGKIAQQGISAQASKAGAFGGARHGVMSAEQQRNLQQQLGDIQTKGQQQSYDRAAAQFGADRAAQMEATGKTQGFKQAEAGLGMTAQQQTEAGKQAQAQMGMTAQKETEGSRQFRAKFQQQARDQQLKASAAQQDLGKAQQSLDAARYNMQNAVGAEQKKLAQQNLDKAFNDFANKRDYSRQQLAFYNTMLRGMPTPVQQEVRQIQPAPSTLGQIGGLGIGALGAYNAFGGRG